MLKSSGAMALATLISRLLGMVREMVYAAFMGDKWVAAAFTVAFQIPNLFRRLLGEGALTAAFIPIFKEKEKTAGEKEMWLAANAVISGLVVASALVVAVVLLGVTVALGAHEFAIQTELMLRLLRWMFPYMLMVCVAAALMGMCNARGHFFIPAMSAAVLNIVMIASVVFLAPRWPGGLRDKIFALAVGVLVAGVAQAAFQVPTLWREGFRYHWVTPWGNETVGRVVRQMIPGAIGVAAFQINVVIIQSLGLWLETPEHPLIASFNYAVRLMELPQGIFGISLATYMLPTLSGLAAEKDWAGFRATLRSGMEHLLLVNLLMAVLLVTEAEPIIRLLFERGKFTAESTARATLALECLGGSLVGYSLVNVLARAFYAVGDTKTPMKISIFCLGLNLVFVLILVWPLRQGGLGLANTISSGFNFALLLFALRKKLGRLELKQVCSQLPVLIFATVLAAAISWWGCQYWDGAVGHGTIVLKIGAVFVPAIVASTVYGAVVLAARVPAAHELLDLVLHRFKRGKA